MAASSRALRDDLLSYLRKTHRWIEQVPLAVYIGLSLAAFAYYGPGEEAVTAFLSIALGGL